MALHEALDKGADEAIMMDKNGYISEGSGENIFIVKDSTIFTPTTEHCLKHRKFLVILFLLSFSSASTLLKWNNSTVCNANSNRSRT